MSNFFIVLFYILRASIKLNFRETIYFQAPNNLFIFTFSKL